jgi:serine-type D-Ala-D-Ala carboxypeptidase (penicillin-binding protein 5/6)
MKIKKRNSRLTKKMIFLFLLFLIIIFSFYLINKNKNNNQEIVEPEKEVEIEIYKSLMPIRKWDKEYPSIIARSALVAYIDIDKNKKFLLEKNQNLKVPIASITKLMTALIVLENYDLNELILISNNAVNSDYFKINAFFQEEEYTVKSLLHSLLMESNNAAAYALAERIKKNEMESPTSVNNFVKLMNEKAKSLGMTNTSFSNPSGLDPVNKNDEINYSTASDLVILIENILEKDLIWEILSLPEYDLSREDGFFKYKIKNTNILLDNFPSIVGGKTGTTSRAQQCFVSVFKKNDNEYLISVILGSNDRFKETKTILEWVNDSYYWEINEWLINK